VLYKCVFSYNAQQLLSADFGMTDVNHEFMNSSSSSCFLFLDPQNEVGPSISSSVILRSFVLLVYIVMLVLVFYLCPSSVCVAATFSGMVLFPVLCSVHLFLNL